MPEDAPTVAPSAACPTASRPSRAARQRGLPRWLCALAVAALQLGAFPATVPGEVASAAPATLAAPAADAWKDGASVTLFERVIALNRIEEPELDVAAAKRAFDALLGQARAALGSCTTPQERVSALNKVLLDNRQVSYLSNEYWRDASLVASLMRCKGNCLATSTLYALVGGALGLPIHLVVVPSHAFVRWDDGSVRINIETTNHGLRYDDERYLNVGGQATREDIAALHWGSSLDDNGLVSELLMVACGHLRGQNHIAEAIELARKAFALAPYRADVALAISQLQSDLDHDIPAEQRRMAEMLRQQLPPTLATTILLRLANQDSAVGNHAKELQELFAAYRIAPKTSERGVLTMLSICYRSLRDMHAAVCFQALAVASENPGSPELAGDLYNLAIMQKQDGHIDIALQTIERALEINPESWNLKVLKSGYLALSGQKERGLALFATIQPPRAEAEFYDCMHTWFLCVTKQEDAFFAQLKTTLDRANSLGIITWIDQDTDLDAYRHDPRFVALTEAYRKRVTGAAATTQPTGSAR